MKQIVAAVLKTLRLEVHSLAVLSKSLTRKRGSWNGRFLEDHFALLPLTAAGWCAFLGSERGKEKDSDNKSLRR
jgi:hypothetical protein